MDPQAGFESLKRPARISDFVLVKQMGQGAYGKVVKVRSKEEGREYAMKIIPKRAIENLKMIDQVKREVMIMNSVKHENLIELITYFEDGKNIYLVMFLAEEDHLYKRLKKVKRYPESDAAKVNP